MSIFKVLDEKELRDRLCKELDKVPFHNVRNAYMEAFGPIDIYINERGHIAFDERGMNWEQYQNGARSGWIASVDGQPVYRTEDIRMPSAHERFLAFTNAKALGYIEHDTDLSTKSHEEVQTPFPPFLGNPSESERPPTWNPRGELTDYVKQCTPDQLEAMARKVLKLPYCNRRGREFAIVEGKPREGAQYYDRNSLGREMSRLLNHATEEQFARLCSEALGKECVPLGDGGFVVHEKGPDEGLTHGRPAPAR